MSFVTRRTSDYYSPSKPGTEISKHLLFESPTRSPQKPRLILWNEFELGDQIGAGSFGDVYKCKHVKSGKDFAIKRFKNKYNTKRKAFELREI